MGKLTFEESRHLLARVALGGTRREIERYVGMEREAAVDHLLSTFSGRAHRPPPSWVEEPPERPQRIRSMSEEERRVFRRQRRRMSVELKGWWCAEMATTPSPLTEFMTLFWHNHFTSSLRKVKSPWLIWRQHEMFRARALGNFGHFLHAISQDAAMTRYLDNASNRVGRPNENFARELLELFTLGEGHYTERDVKEAARAFTGWSVERARGTFAYRPRQHDFGEKVFLGRRGRLNGDDIIEILLDQPQLARFIAGIFWRRLIGGAPRDEQIEPLAEAFRDSDYSIRVLLRRTLLADEFWAPERRGHLIKSPVEFVVGTVRQFQVQSLIEAPHVMARAVRALGQDLFDPPNVKGWPGGTAWIDASSLALRQELVERILRGDEMPAMGPERQGAGRGRPGRGMARRRGRGRRRGGGMRSPMMRSAAPRVRLGIDAWLDSFDLEDGSARHLVEKILLPIAPTASEAATATGRHLVATLLLDPAYNLK